jgi:tetratricopeptide (TPR) repeat protein
MSRNLAIIAILLLLTGLTFSEVRHFGFVSYDDPDYITGNRLVQQGVTREGLAWAFGQLHGSETYWHPITWVTHMLDCQLFGVNGGPHHVVSLAFHAANVLLLFLLLRRATGAVWTSAMVAALFAVHPFQVESVGWVTERKNVVSTFFAILTLFAYVRYTEARKPRWYAAALGCFVLALMSKPAVVTIPCVMILLDYWPLGRLKLFGPGPSGRFTATKLKESAPLFLEKVPFFLLSLATSALTIFAHRQLGMLEAHTKPPALLRFENTILSYFEYLRKVFWPVDLAAFYPFPKFISPEEVAGAVIVLAALTVFALWNLKRRPYLAVGWLWFVGVLFPMSGIVAVGIQAMADRFMYVPLIGVLIMVCFGARELLSKMASGRKIATVSAAVVLVACVGLSRAQVQSWKGDYELFERAREVTKDNYMAYTAVGGILLRQGKFDEAMSNFQTALVLEPNFPDIHLSLGYAMLYRGKFPEAAEEFQQALRLRPRYFEARSNLGVAYEYMGNAPAAIENFNEALQLNPNLTQAHLHLGNVLLTQGRFKEALQHFRKAVELEPNSVEALGRLSWLLATHADPTVRNGAEAVTLAQRACQLTKFEQAQILNALAAAYAESGKLDLATQTAQKALEIARSKQQANLIPMTESLLKLYQSGKPYREGND